MGRAAKVWLWCFALPVAAAVVVSRAVFWVQQEDSAPSGQLVSPEPAEGPPVAALVAPDPSPRASVLGTEASVSVEALRLRLFATVPGRSPAEGTAVIGTHANNPQTYAVGSLMASGATIEEVHPDFVVLAASGERVRLYRVGLENADTKALIAATTVGGPGVTNRPVDDRVTSRPDLGDFIRPRVVFEDGRVAGFEVNAGRSAYQLANSDLEPGDIIRSIDGRPVTVDADWQRITTALGKGESLILGIDRKDSAISVVMDGARIAGDAKTETVVTQIPSSK